MPGFLSLAYHEEAGAKISSHVNPLIDGELLGNGMNPQHCPAVHMGIDYSHLICFIRVFDQKLFAQLLGGITFYIVGLAE